VRFLVAVAIFIGVSVVLALVLSALGVAGLGAGLLEILGSIIATVAYWRRSAPNADRMPVVDDS
jgi:hypothetical protein